MKALVLHQPWASLIALGVKTIETRPKPPNGPMRPAGVQGLPGRSIERGERIAIVAGKSPAGLLSMADDEEAGWAIANMGERFGTYYCTRTFELDDTASESCMPLTLPTGVVVCTIAGDDALAMVDERGWLVDADTPDRVISLGWSWDEASIIGPSGDDVDIADQIPYGNFAAGRWGWLLADLVVTPEPIPCVGRQGMFDLPAEITEALS